MRISDWSSDVCSSDLQRRTERGGAGAQEVEVQHARQLADRGGRVRAALDIFTKRERQAEVGEHIAAVEQHDEELLYAAGLHAVGEQQLPQTGDRKSTRLNPSH